MISARQLPEPQGGAQIAYIQAIWALWAPLGGPSDFHHENVALCRRGLSDIFARILPLLWQNSATFVAEFCHFSARILPLLCQNSATFVTYFGHLGGRIVPLLVRRARLRGPVVQRAPPKRVVVGSIPGTVIRGGVATS
jgi:hypothetical protein